MTVENLKACDPAMLAAMRALNNRFHEETSWLEPEEWDRLVGMAQVAHLITNPDGEGMGFLIAFAPGAAYDSPNYLWFCERLERFIYIDRVLVHPDHQRKGVAAALYADLAAIAHSEGCEAIVCEVNHTPPNPISDQFHERLGFTEMGRGSPSAGKIVRYLSLDLQS